MMKATSKVIKAKNSTFAIQNVLRLITLKTKPPATRPKHRKTIANSNIIDTLRMCDLPPAIIPLARLIGLADDWKMGMRWSCTVIDTHYYGR